METQLVYGVWALLWILSSSVDTKLIYDDSTCLLRLSLSIESELFYTVWVLLWRHSSSSVGTQLAYGDSVLLGDSNRQWRLTSSMETRFVNGDWARQLRLGSSMENQLIYGDSSHLWSLTFSIETDLFCGHSARIWRLGLSMNALLYMEAQLDY